MWCAVPAGSASASTLSRPAASFPDPPSVVLSAVGRLLDSWYESSARRELTSLAEHLGLTAPSGLRGLAPWILAGVDQHAAAVRDILLFNGGRLGPVELAGYARGVQDVAREAGWRAAPCDQDAAWAADWVNLRLTAVWRALSLWPLTHLGGRSAEWAADRPGNPAE